jgi:O-6-methylguanine DNA methyltransferase
VSFTRTTDAFGAALRRHHATIVQSEARLAPVRRSPSISPARVSASSCRSISVRSRRSSVVSCGGAPHSARRVVSYGELARRISAPEAARAVRQALGRNVPIVIPCHRIVAGSGRLGGPSGRHRQRSFLRLEGADKRTGTWSHAESSRIGPAPGQHPGAYSGVQAISRVATDLRVAPRLL